MQKPAASHCSGRRQKKRGGDAITTSLPQHPQPNFITKATFLSHSASPAFKEQAGPGPGLGGSLCFPPRLLVGQSQFWRQQMGSQDGLTRHLKVRHKRQECENLSVREPLAPAAPHLSCWCDFPAGKGRLEQSPSLQGHPRQMARHPFGSHLLGDGEHGSGGYRWPPPFNIKIQ